MYKHFIFKVIKHNSNLTNNTTDYINQQWKINNNKTTCVIKRIFHYAQEIT